MYKRRTSGILLELDIPAIIGLSAPYQNAGVVDNTGWDLLVNYRSEEHTSELQSLMRISYAVFCWKKKTSIQFQHQMLPLSTYYHILHYSKHPHLTLPTLMQ